MNNVGHLQSLRTDTTGKLCIACALDCWYLMDSFRPVFTTFIGRCRWLDPPQGTKPRPSAEQIPEVLQILLLYKLTPTSTKTSFSAPHGCVYTTDFLAATFLTIWHVPTDEV
jgi:hypothetical protein